MAFSTSLPGKSWTVLLAARIGVAICAALLLIPPVGCGAFQPPPRAESMATSAVLSIERDAFRLPGGERIPATYRILDNAGPIVVAVHGLGGYARDFDYLMEDFVDHGLSVVAFDLRGLGRWPEPRGKLRNIGVWLADLDGVLASLRRAHPGRRIVLLGESMGAAVAAWYQLEAVAAGRSGADALVAFSVVVDPQVKLGFARAVGIGFAFTFAPGKYVNIEPEPGTISSDPKFQERFTSDPHMTRRASLRFLGQVQSIVKEAPRRLAAIDRPMLIVQPGDDIFSSEKGRAELRKTVPNTTYEEVADCKHAMMNDTCRDRLFAITRRWLAATLAAPRAGDAEARPEIGDNR